MKTKLTKEKFYLNLGFITGMLANGCVKKFTDKDLQLCIQKLQQIKEIFETYTQKQEK